MLLQHFGAFVEYWSFDFPYETDFTDSLGGSWYVSPTHHAVEILTLAPLYVGLTCWFGYRALYKNTMAYRLLTTNAPRPRRTLMESILLLLLIASFATTVIHKAANNTLLFLMQPCHASAVLLILVMSWPDHKYAMIPRTLFNIYLHTLWGAILALIWPDLRNHDMLGEVSNFFLEHTLVLLLPFYLITTGRYMVVPASLDLALLSFFLYAAYHSPMLHILSLYSGFNLNYVLVPPALKFLIAAGVWYRFIMYMTALIMMFFTRYILVGTWLFLVHGQLKNKKQA